MLIEFTGNQFFLLLWSFVFLWRSLTFQLTLSYVLVGYTLIALLADIR